MESPASALSERVRALVREQRIDPRSQAHAVRDLAHSVVAEHDRRSLSGAVSPIEQPDLVVSQILADVAGFGPLQGFLEDPEIEEIWINEPDRVFIARAGRPELTSVVLSTAQVRELVERMLSSSGRRLDVSRPFVDATLPGGHRLHVVLEGISRDFAAVNIRKYVARAACLTDLIDLGTPFWSTSDLSRGHANRRPVVHHLHDWASVWLPVRVAIRRYVCAASIGARSFQKCD